jgi:hypothetical protein
VRKQLKSNERMARQNACKVLKEIGTKESIPDLEAVLASNPSAKREAQTAIDAIRARHK